MMYRRMNPKQLEKIIEEVKKRKEEEKPLLAIVSPEGAKTVENIEKYLEPEKTTDTPTLDRP